MGWKKKVGIGFLAFFGFIVITSLAVVMIPTEQRQSADYREEEVLLKTSEQQEELDALNDKFEEHNDVFANHIQKYSELIPLTKKCTGIIAELDTPELIHTIPDECKTVYAQAKEVLTIVDDIDYDALQAGYHALFGDSYIQDGRYHYENKRFGWLNDDKDKLQRELFEALDEYDALTEQYGCDVISC